MDRKPDLDELTGAIYDAAVDRQAWATALTSITAALRARMATIEIWDRKSDSPPFFAAPGADPDYIRDYLERWFNCDIVREQGLALPVGAVYQLENLRMPRAEFERTPFYNEFWVPQRANVGLFTNAANEAAVVGGIGFYRSWKEGGFDRDEGRLLGGIGR